MMRGRRIMRNQQGDRPGSGIGGYCVCPNCGHKTPHTRATPCNLKTCPKCKTKMTRE